MADTSFSQRLLVLSGPESRQSGIIDLLKTQHEVIVAETMEGALQELRKGSVDAVFSGSSDFLPLERAVVQQQASLILDTIGEGICITDEAGEILWANRRMKDWPEPVRDRVRKVCLDAWNTFTTQMTALTPDVNGVPGSTRSRKFSFSIDDMQYFELFCSPVVNAERKVTQIVAICWDATSGRRLQQKIDAIDQAGHELVRLEGESIAKLNVGQRLKLLEEKIITLCRKLMHFDHFAIRLLDRKSNRLELVFSVGMPTEAMEIELYAEADGNGISGYVAATGRSYICADVSKDPRYVMGLTNAGSSLTVPLRLHDKVVGVFNIESSRPSAFTEDDRQFAEIFGRYVAVALNILNLLVVERHTTTGRLASDVSTEIAGPLNDIVSEATLLMDDYIGNDDMRKRLQTIVDNVTKIRRSVREVAEGTGSVLKGSDKEVAADPLLSGKRVLVADDEPNIRQTIADLLSRFGCKVDTAADGGEAMSLLGGPSVYDLVLSDIKMPHKNGYEIFAASQKMAKRPAVMLMTGFGYDPNHSIVRASQEGLAAVLFKPFKVEQFMVEVRKALTKGGEKSVDRRQ